MKLYEGYFVYPAEAAPEVRKSQVKTLEDLMKKFNGHIVQRTEVGRRVLGYAIRKNRDGHVLVWDFEMDPAQQEAMRKSLDLDEQLVTYMITHKEKQKAPAEVKPAAAPVAAAPAPASARPPFKRPSAPASQEHKVPAV